MVDNPQKNHFRNFRSSWYYASRWLGTWHVLRSLQEQFDRASPRRACGCGRGTDGNGGRRLRFDWVGSEGLVVKATYIGLELPSPFKFCHFRSVTLFFLNRPLFWQTRHFDPNNQFPLIPMVFHPKPEPQDKMAQKCWKWPLCLKRPARAWLFFIFWHWESGMSGEKKTGAWNTLLVCWAFPGSKTGLPYCKCKFSIPLVQHAYSLAYA